MKQVVAKPCAIRVRTNVRAGRGETMQHSQAVAAPIRVRTDVRAGGMTMRGNAESKKPDYSTYLALKDVFKDLERWKEAADAAKRFSKDAMRKRVVSSRTHNGCVPTTRTF